MLVHTLRNSATWCLSFVVLASIAVAQETVTQEAYIKASNPGFHEFFGERLAISGDTLIVGARRESSNATGVNGNQNDNSAVGAGAAYIFVRTASGWSQQAYLKAPASSSQALNFGQSVAVSGDLAVVAGREAQVGHAYVYRRTGTDWSYEATMTGTNTGASDRFGRSLAISGTSIFVGAASEASNSTGINGNEADDSSPQSGAAYVFVQSGTSWIQEAFIKASNAEPDDRFGSSITADGNTLVVCADREDSNATGVGGDESNNAGTNSGAAYVFDRTGTTWSQVAYIKPSNTAFLTSFGQSCSMDGATLIIGTESEGSSGTGINGDQNNSDAILSGAAYIFTRTQGSWSQQAYVKASNAIAEAGFGLSVGVNGDIAVVGAYTESNGASGVNGNQASGHILDSGAAYAFSRTGTVWTQVAYLKEPNPGTFIRYGRSIGVSGDIVVVGSNNENGSGSGINSDPTLGLLSRSGAAFVYDLKAMLPTNVAGVDFCSGDGGDQLGCVNCPCMNNAAQGTAGGCLNSAATSARLTATGDTSVSLHFAAATDLRFGLSGLPGSVFSVLTSGDSLSPTNAANPCFGISNGVQSISFDGMRCAVVNTRRHTGRQSDSAGEIGTTNSPWGGEASPQAGIATAGLGFITGQTRYFQAIYRDDASLSCMRGLNTSQAIEIVFTP